MSIPIGHLCDIVFLEEIGCLCFLATTGLQGEISNEKPRGWVELLLLTFYFMSDKCKQSPMVSAVTVLQ
jgi:hypothetical protein